MFATLGQSKILQQVHHFAQLEEDPTERETKGTERYFTLRRVMRTLARTASCTTLRNDAAWAYFLVTYLPDKSHWGLQCGPVLAASNETIAAKFAAVEDQMREQLGIRQYRAGSRPLSARQVTERLAKLKARGWLVPHRPARNHARRYRPIGGDPTFASRGYNFSGLLAELEVLELQATSAARRVAALERERSALLDMIEGASSCTLIGAAMRSIRRSVERLRTTSPDAEINVAARRRELEALLNNRNSPGLSPSTGAAPPPDSGDEPSRKTRPKYNPIKLTDSCSWGRLSRGSGRVWPCSPPGTGVAEWSSADLQRSGFTPSEATILFPVLKIWTDGILSWGELERLAWVSAQASGLSGRLVDEAQQTAGSAVMSLMVCVALQRLSDGQLTCGSPLPYFRSMLGALKRGELNLSPTIHGYRAKTKQRLH